MRQEEAFSILGISGEAVTLDDIKKAYRKVAQKYHPDRNPAGLEMMKMINAAHEALKDFCGVANAGHTHNYGEEINAALNTISDLGLAIEVCGAWVWVTGDTKPHRTILKEAGFFWACKKMAWYYRPENFKSSNQGQLSLNEIRAKYGSQKINGEEKKRLAG